MREGDGVEGEEMEGAALPASFVFPRLSRGGNDSLSFALRHVLRDDVREAGK